MPRIEDAVCVSKDQWLQGRVCIELYGERSMNSREGQNQQRLK